MNRGEQVSRAQRNLISTTAAAALFWLALATMSAQTSPSNSNQNANASSDLESIVSHLAEVQYRNRRAIRPYVVTREYKLFADTRDKAESEVMAEISFLPPGTKQYAIKSTEGSGRGEKVVRKVLAHEQEMASDWEETSLTGRNYDFQLVGEENLDGHRCYVLKIVPKRDVKDLIRGTAWIDTDTYNTIRIAGQPAKSPSWWVKRVDLTLTFSDVDGMWLQTGATANAEVRLMGKHVLTSQDVKYDTGGESVAARSAQRSAQHGRAQQSLATILLSR